MDGESLIDSITSSSYNFVSNVLQYSYDILNLQTDQSNETKFYEVGEWKQNEVTLQEDQINWPGSA